MLSEITTPLVGFRFLSPTATGSSTSVALSIGSLETGLAGPEVDLRLVLSPLAISRQLLIADPGGLLSFFFTVVPVLEQKSKHLQGYLSLFIILLGYRCALTIVPNNEVGLQPCLIYFLSLSRLGD